MHFRSSRRLEIQGAFSWAIELSNGARALDRISRAGLATAILAINVWAQPGAGISPTLSSQTPSLEPASVRQSSGGYLGVYLGDVNDERARELKLPEIRGAVVGKVEEGSPGEKAGLKENDVILSFNEYQIQNRSQFHRLLQATPAGSKVNLGISREGKAQSLAATLGERRQAADVQRASLFSEVNAMLQLAEQSRRQAEELKLKGDEKGAAALFEEERAVRKEAESRRSYIEKELREGRIGQPAAVHRPDMAELAVNRFPLGLHAIELTEQLAAFFNVTGSGVLITEVRAGESAENAGIKAGDCIVAINGERVSLPADLNRIRMDKHDKHLTELIITIVRDRAEQAVKIRIEPR